MTLFLPFEKPATSDWLDGLEEDDGLRWYQREAIEAVHTQLAENRSTLIVMATGCGKTRVFSQLIRDWTAGPVLVLAHREELIQQAAESLERLVGESVDIERAKEQAGFRARYVVGSVPSVSQPKRLERMGHERFSLIVTDEAHHSCASSYQRIYDWFGPAKHLGVTATPDRGDEKALGKVYDSVAYVFDIEQGIDDGVLVPIRGRHVDVKEADVSSLKTKAGDLSEGDLDEVMVNAVSGIVTETLRLEPDRKGIAFWPGVRSSQLAAETFNRLKPGSAVHIDASTKRDERAQIVRDFKRGVFQYLMNVGIATEGFDAPDVSLVIHGRPTKSRSLYAQMSGRGTRILPGLVDHLVGPGLAPQRRMRVANSAKPDLMMLDFVANSGKHDLVTPEDLLGGSYTDAEVKLAKSKRGKGGDVTAELEKARKELEAMARAAAERTHKAEVKDYDPFRAFGMNVSENQRYARFGKPVPQWLKDMLIKKGVDSEEVGRLNAKSAFMLKREMELRHSEGLCTYKQSKILQRYGVDASKVSFLNATSALDYVFSCRKRGDKIDGGRLDALVRRERQPGED